MKVHHGCSLEVLKTFADDSIDSVVTDPPYGWRFMGKAWDAFDIVRMKISAQGPAPRVSSDGVTRQARQKPAEAAGKYDNGVEANRAFQMFTKEWAREAFRVLKPGGHMVVFCGPRTYHRMASGVEDAGFEIRDQLQWLFGSGFPKSMDVSKAIDKAAGAEREVIGAKKYAGGHVQNSTTAMVGNNYGRGETSDADERTITAPATEDAKKWQGFGTALKPAVEPVVLARKPLTSAGLLNSLALECQSLLSAEIATLVSASSLSEQTRQSIAQWNADGTTPTPAALSEVTATLPLKSASDSSLSIDLSWLSTLADLSKHANTFTTETASSLIIDLKTLNYFLSSCTRDSITLAETDQLGQNTNALRVAALFSAVSTKLDYILTHSAQGNAIGEVGHSSSPLAASPANEPIVLARKPLAEKTVAKNVLKHGTGALNIDASRIACDWSTDPTRRGWQGCQGDGTNQCEGMGFKNPNTAGRWPSNVLLACDCETDTHVGDCAVGELDRQSGVLKSGLMTHAPKLESEQPSGWKTGKRNQVGSTFGDTGGASRFFLVVKRCAEDTLSLCGNESIKVDDTSAGNNQANSTEDLNTGGSGSKPTDQYHLTTTFITETATHSTMSCLISSVCTKTLTGLITIASEKTIDSFSGESVVGVSVVSDTEVLIDLNDGRQELIKGTVTIVQRLTSENGGTETANGITNTIDPIARGARSFYVAKTSKRERNAGLKTPSSHPTVKPVRLMEYLIRLITPPGGVVLDPFTGSGSTGVAAVKLGFEFIGIEKELEYVEIARRRIDHVR